MQKLHLVGITPELDGLILSARKGAKSGSFVVSVDASVLQQLTDAATNKGGRPGGRTNGTRPGHAPRTSSPESQLTPREMQELLRAGWTIEEVAVEAGVDIDWVSRFASPVLAELSRVIDASRELVFDKPRVGPSALALAASVRRNVAERGLRFTDEDFDDAWRAHQLDDVLWVVAFEYTSRGRAQRAEWVVDLEEAELASNNRLGSQLGYVQSARRRVSTAAPAKPKSKASKATAKKAPAKKATPRGRQTASRSTKAPAKKAAAKKRSTKPDAASADAPPKPPNPQHDPYREELRRRLADPVTAPRPPASPAPPPPAPVERRPPPAPPPAPAPTPAPRREVEHKPVAIIGPTVRSLTRKLPPRREPPPPPPPPRRQTPTPKPTPPEPDTGPTPVVREDDLPDLSWSPAPKRGPMPPPEPIPVPEEIKEKVASPLGRVDDDDLQAETWFPKGPTFKGARQGATTASAGAPRRRRDEPLRGR